MKSVRESSARYALTALLVVPAMAQAVPPEDPNSTASGRTRVLQVVQSATSFTIEGFTLEGNTLVETEAAMQALAPFIGPDKGMEDIQKAAAALRGLYEAAGYAVVKVYAPQQVSADGRIALKVVEGRVRTVAVSGNSYYSEANIRASLPTLQEGQAPNAKAIVASIAAANENPAKQVAVNFQAAAEPGAIDATVKVTEDRPEKYTLSYDNAGSKTTGVHKVALGYQHANLFDRDHMLTAQLGSSLDEPDKALNLSLGYRLPLYHQGLSLDLVAAYSDTDTGQTITPAGPMTYTGQGTMLAARLNQPLESLGEYRHKLTYGLDYKDFSNSCTGVATPTCGTVTSRPASFAYTGQLNTPSFQAGGTLSFAANLPGGAHGSEEEYALVRLRADNTWSVLRFNGQLALPLPRDWQFRAALNAQQTSDRLIPAEQFGVGGASSVRGYTERAISADKGYGINLEAYTPEFGKHLPIADASLRGVFFYDFGNVRSAQPTLAERSQSIAAVGAGLRFAQGRDLSARLDLGRALKRLNAAPGTGVGRQPGDAFAHIAVNYTF